TSPCGMWRHSRNWPRRPSRPSAPPPSCHFRHPGAARRAPSGWHPKGCNLRRASTMTTKTSNVAQTLAQLGITRAEHVAPLFAELRAEFDGAAPAVRDDASWKAFRDAWLGRKSGVLTQVTENWLKPASPELKRAVGQSLNELRAHVEAVVEASRARVEA